VLERPRAAVGCGGGRGRRFSNQAMVRRSEAPRFDGCRVNVGAPA
jgi:hypothetical protein